MAMEKSIDESQGQALVSFVRGQRIHRPLRLAHPIDINRSLPTEVAPNRPQWQTVLAGAPSGADQQGTDGF